MLSTQEKLLRMPKNETLNQRGGHHVTETDRKERESGNRKNN